MCRLRCVGCVPRLSEGTQTRTARCIHKAGRMVTPSHDRSKYIYIVSVDNKAYRAKHQPVSPASRSLLPHYVSSSPRCRTRHLQKSGRGWTPFTVVALKTSADASGTTTRKVKGKRVVHEYVGSLCSKLLHFAGPLATERSLKHNLRSSSSSKLSARNPPQLSPRTHSTENNVRRG